ncbi:MAG: biotin synthase BioB [Desulfobacteraceae bacterium]|jgi:biotin synthase
MQLSTEFITNFSQGKVLAPIPTAEALLEMVTGPDHTILGLLLQANALRRHYKGNNIFTCSILNAKSGRCSENCAFCAQSGHHRTNISVYPLMPKEEIVIKAKEMAESGSLRFSIVISGFQPSQAELETIYAAVGMIRSETNLQVCASLGNLTEDMANCLYQSGVSNYHHNLETARSYFDQICTTHSYEEDIQSLIIAKEAGMRVCSGGIMGLGESWAQRMELALTLKELGVDSIPMNFLNPIAGTPFETRPLLSPMAALKCIALFRIINPEKEIVVCGGREVTLKDYQSWVFLAGASGLMIGNYLTTCGRDIDADMSMIFQQGLSNRLADINTENL